MWLSVNVQLYTERAVCVLYNLFYNTNKLVSLGLVAVAYLDVWHLFLFSPEGLVLLVIPTFVDTSIIRHKQGKVNSNRKSFLLIFFGGIAFPAYVSIIQTPTDIMGIWGRVLKLRNTTVTFGSLDFLPKKLVVVFRVSA